MPNFTPIVFFIVTYPADSGLIESFEFGKSFKGSSGVGLYYCRMFVEANRGELSITSPGKEKGTTVRITFDHARETGKVQAKNEL
jgi:signal transduction histidine kinase